MTEAATGDGGTIEVDPKEYRRVMGQFPTGVTVVAELVLPYRRWLEFTREGRDYEAMVHYRQGSDGHFDTPDMKGKTIFEHTLYKALRGWVDPRQCERFDGFRRFEIAPKLRGA